MVRSTTTPPLQIWNPTSSILEIMVEVNPDRYLLQPDDKMEIEADPRGVPFTILPYEGGLQIYPGNTAGAVVTINGVRVAPDWTTEIASVIKPLGG